VQAVEPRGIESLADDPLDDPAHCHPGDPHDLGHRGLVGHPGQVGGGLLERRAEPAAGRAPGNLFVDHSALSALHTARRVAEPDPRRTEIEVTPLASLSLVIAGRPLPTSAAARFFRRGRTSNTTPSEPTSADSTTMPVIPKRVSSTLAMRTEPSLLNCRFGHQQKSTGSVRFSIHFQPL
jgi:hypothetical protein